jgi:SAM-dependent methyltransferase
MKQFRLQQHVCPKCHSKLVEFQNTIRSDSGEIESGAVVCRDCGSTFPIINGLPRFVPEDNYADSFGFQWNRHARTQLDSHSGRSISHDRLWAALGGKVDLHGLRVLEAGSGAGRFTEVLVASGADLVTFDYSSAVDANASNLVPSPTLHLFQGDIFNIPLEEKSFDIVICLGVIQHTPDPQAAFISLAKYVRPGGKLIIDSYCKNIYSIFSWKYWLRPITMRMRKETLYRLIEIVTPPLVPVAKWLRIIAGRVGARLVPIVEYSHLGLSPELNIQWAILDTFDMYSPAHDHPQTLAAVNRWFTDQGFEELDIRRGLNGIVGYGRRPL